MSTKKRSHAPITWEWSKEPSKLYSCSCKSDGLEKLAESSSWIFDSHNIVCPSGCRVCWISGCWDAKFWPSEEGSISWEGSQEDNSERFHNSIPSIHRPGPTNNTAGCWSLICAILTRSIEAKVALPPLLEARIWRSCVSTSCALSETVLLPWLFVIASVTALAISNILNSYDIS